MNKLNLINIRNEHIINVFNSISKLKENASRANIAEYTNLSLMTVGKIIDALIENGIVVQYKEARGSPGRKSGILTYNKNKVCRINESIFMDLNFNIVNDTGDYYGSGTVSPDAILVSLAYDEIYAGKLVYCADKQLIIYDNKIISKSNINDLDVVKEVLNPDCIIYNSTEHEFRGTALKLKNIWFETFVNPTKQIIT